jgi:hypothetical protein
MSLNGSALHTVPHYIPCRTSYRARKMYLKLMHAQDMFGFNRSKSGTTDGATLLSPLFVLLNQVVRVRH